jgi:SAM-dependent methyltransferase
MNRERDLLGSNGYERELGLNPLDRLSEKLVHQTHVAWLDLCCGTGKALIQAARTTSDNRLADRVRIVGVDLAGLFHPVEPRLTALRLVEASLSTWRPEHDFDLITCVHGLHYIGDKLGLIARACSWLTSDGLFVANLDLANIKLRDGKPAARTVTTRLRAAGIEYDRRRRLIVCHGKSTVNQGLHYLGADDRAGPNYTRQPAVDSYYD